MPKEVFKPEAKNKVDINGLFEEEDKENEDELYFADSKGKVYNTKESDNKSKWTDVDVLHTNKKNKTTFSVMSRMVSKKNF